jgi:hypothetical protein
MRDYLTLHLDTNCSIGTACSKKNMGVHEHERLFNILLRHRLSRGTTLLSVIM